MIKLLFSAATGIAIAIILSIINIFIIGWVLQLLWNLSVPAVFHLPVITYIQSAALYAIITLLFKSPTITSSNTTTKKS
jgi:hypothetical protein